MRQIALRDHYLGTIDQTGVHIQLYAASNIQAEVNGHPIGLRIDIDYPWDGKVLVRVEETPVGEWTLSLRIPKWCTQFDLRVNGEFAAIARVDRYAVLRRAWHAGDGVGLNLSMPVRGCVALERGPLVYCFEGIDQP